MPRQLIRPVTHPLISQPVISASPHALSKGGGVRPPAASAAQMLTAICGNSIAAANQFNYASTGRFSALAAVQWANMLGGSPFRFPRMTATTRTDRHGIYGHGGYRLDEINTEIQTDWFAAWDTYGTDPDMVIGLALTENDLGQGASSATIIGRIDAWIDLVQTQWPDARIWLCTPHLSFSYNTPEIVAAYVAVRDYILSLDNGQPDSSIIVTRMDGREQPGETGIPAYVNITASISGTKLTVTAADGVVNPGAKLFAASGVTTTDIRSYDTGRGGTGDYNIVTSQTVASQAMKAATHTDDGPHPNARGAVYDGRALAATAARIALTWTCPFTIVSNSLTLTGTGAATGTNVTGTKPTNVTFGGSANATFVLDALEPGYEEAITGVATVVNSNALIDLSRPALGSHSAAPVQVSPYIKFELVSGAANLKHISLEPRINDGGGNNFQQYLLTTSNDAEPDFEDGDVLTIFVPPMVAASGSISAMQNYVGRTMKLNQDGEGDFTYRILEQGFALVA